MRVATGIHFILYVRDQDAARDFYERVLDAPPRLHAPGMTEFEVAPGTVLGLMPERGIARLLDLGAAETPGGGIRGEVYLITPSPEACHRRALAAGARELSAMAPRDWGHRAAYSLDPDGYVLAFAEPMAGAARPGCTFLRRLAVAAVIAVVNLASVGVGFWAWRLAGVSDQLAVQFPVALTVGTLGVTAWLCGGARLHGLAPGRDQAVALALALPVGAILFVGAHRVATGYLTSFGNLAALWAVQAVENALALGLAADRAKREHRDTRRSSV